MPDILLLLKSLELNVAVDSFEILCFYYKYTDSKLKLIHQLYPDVILVNVENLCEKYAFLEHSKFIANNYYSPCLFVKFLCIKYLCYFDSLIYLDRDTFVMQDFSLYLNELREKKIDLAVWESNDVAVLCDKYHIGMNLNILSEFVKINHNISSYTPKIKKPNNGVIFFFKSLLNKLNIYELFDDIYNICEFQKSFINETYITDEDILAYLISTNDINVYKLPDTLNFIPCVFSLPLNSSTTIDDDFSENYNHIYIIHLIASDKRSPYISAVFPETEVAKKSLIDNLTAVTDVNLSVAINDVLSVLNKVSTSFDGKTRLIQLLSLKNGIFYQEFYHSVYKFALSSKFFYIEQLSCNLTFIMFIKNSDQRTRLLISPQLMDLGLIQLNLRIYLDPVRTFKYKSVPDIENSSFIKDISNSFVNSKVYDEDKFIFIRIIVTKFEFLSSLKLLECIFEEHQKELYAKFL